MVIGDIQLSDIHINDNAYIGIDPGKDGGIAVIFSDNRSPAVIPMILAGKSIDISATVKWLDDVLDTVLNPVSCIEKVHAMPGNGAASMFKFGFVTGVMHGIFSTMCIPLHLVTPQAWKKIILQGTSKDKAAAVEYCRRVYPTVNLLATERSRTPHDGMADALCIARYAQLTIGKNR